jgi:hypothetical protein
MNSSRAQLLAIGVSCLVLAAAAFLGWLFEPVMESVLRPFR